LYRELTMIEDREVLRRFGARHSKRRIGRDTGMGRNTVDRYLAAAEERGVGAASGEPSAELVAAVIRAVQDRPAPAPSDQRLALQAQREQIETGRTRKRWALIVTLSHSRHEFVYPTFSQDLSQVCAGIDAAREVFRWHARTHRARQHEDSGGGRERDGASSQRCIHRLRAGARSARRSGTRAKAEGQATRREPGGVRARELVQGEQFPSLDHARSSAETWCRDVAGRRVHGTT
jgi:hypothetical protein